MQFYSLMPMQINKSKKNIKGDEVDVFLTTKNLKRIPSYYEIVS